MHTVSLSLKAASNPFPQIVDPSKVLAAVHRSERLRALASHVFRPLACEPEAGKADEEAHDLVQGLND
jgi:hypothetical protein